MDRPAATSILCSKCHALCENGAGWCWVRHPNGKEYPSVYLHHPSLHALKVQAAEGCGLCSMIWRTLVEFCKLGPLSYEGGADCSGQSHQETEDDIKQIVSRVQDSGILQPPASRRDATSNHQKKRTHTFHPAFDQEDFERSRSVFGSERVLIRARTPNPLDADVKLPESLSVIWLGSIKTCLARNSTSLGRIRLLVDHGKALFLFDLLLFPSQTGWKDIASAAHTCNTATELDFFLLPIIVNANMYSDNTKDDILGQFSQPGGIRPEASLLSDTHLRRISSWREVCSQEHKGCPGGDEPRELPARVIGVNSSDPRYVKLVNTHRGRTAVYACLSYSWGTGFQHCTTTRNIEDHLQRIAISDLPETVADGIRLCRALQIPYIWVDALCIIQDDKDDWSREAAAMAGIYGSSVLTISVPDASDCGEQFLTRNLDEYFNVKVDWIHGLSGTAGTVTLVYDWPSDQSSLLSKSPWMDRGWTLQEWVLSPCVLHCGSITTMYECLHGTCYESHSDEITQPFGGLDLGQYAVDLDLHRSRSVQGPTHYNTWPTETSTKASEEATISVELDNTSRLFKRVVRVQRGHSETQTDAAMPSWSDVVTQFCGRQLTKDTDKLPALAGLAVRFQNYKSATIPRPRTYDYLAGLWWDGSLILSGGASEAAELPAGLLWRRAGDEFLSRPSMYRAPSWSWAALDGPVEFVGVFPPGASRLQIHDALCLYEYPDSLSSVKAGWIDAKGLLRRAWPVKVRGDNIDLNIKKHDGEADGGGDAGNDKWCARLDENVASGSRWREMQRFEVFILLVATYCLPDSLRVTHHAVVLKRVAAEKACQSDCFTRLGTALKVSVSQDDLAERCDACEDEKEKIFKGWDFKKVRLL